MGEPKRFLVTGSQGFVGQKLCAALKARFPGCVVFDLGNDGQSGRIENPNDTRAAAQKLPDMVFHLAAQSSVAQSGSSAEQTVTVNLGGTVCLALALRDYAPNAIVVFASSGETYGSSFLSGQAMTEDMPLQPNSAYARTKAAGEWVLQDLLGDQTTIVCLRLFNHSGAGQDPRFVVPSFAAQIARIEQGDVPPIIKVGNLNAKRDFLHVDDVIDAYIAIAERARELGTGVHTYNVCSGQPTKIEDLLAALISQSEHDITIEIDPNRLRPSDVPIAFGNNTKFRTQMDWAPSRSLEAMLGDVLAQARAN